MATMMARYAYAYNDEDSLIEEDAIRLEEEEEDMIEARGMIISLEQLQTQRRNAGLYYHDEDVASPPPPPHQEQQQQQRKQLPPRSELHTRYSSLYRKTRRQQERQEQRRRQVRTASGRVLPSLEEAEERSSTSMSSGPLPKSRYSMSGSSGAGGATNGPSISSSSSRSPNSRHGSLAAIERSRNQRKQAELKRIEQQESLAKRYPDAMTQMIVRMESGVEDDISVISLDSNASSDWNSLSRRKMWTTNF